MPWDFFEKSQFSYLQKVFPDLQIGLRNFPRMIGPPTYPRELGLSHMQRMNQK